VAEIWQRDDRGWHVVHEGVRDGVLLLHGREHNMRNPCGHYASDEKHEGEELSDGGGLHCCDPQWPTEEWADFGDTWGKPTARSRGLATQKESPNGGVMRTSPAQI
jgi:hypothetical protein